MVRVTGVTTRFARMYQCGLTNRAALRLPSWSLTYSPAGVRRHTLFYVFFRSVDGRNQHSANRTAIMQDVFGNIV